MKHRSVSDYRAAQVRRDRLEHGAEGVAAGAVTGAALGAIAGPPGMAAGAIVGAIAGAAAAMAAEDAVALRELRSEKLDREIGILGGDMGAPNLSHPAPRFGTYSEASLGVSGAEDALAPAEGPMQPPDD
jgi:hypothetical protein